MANIQIKQSANIEKGDGWNPAYLKKTIGRETVEASRTGSMWKKYKYNSETDKVEEMK